MPHKDTIQVARLPLVNFGKPGQSGGPTSTQMKSKYDSSELQYFKRIILLMRQEALEEIRALHDSTKIDRSANRRFDASQSESTADSADMTMTEEAAFLLQRQSKLAGYLEKALLRIESGLYGICQKCSSLIEKERLEAVPHTQHCVRCKTSGRNAA